MKQVYAPANSAEAHMLAHMLEQNGIIAHIHGEALQGGVGELPAGGLLQLLVADEDYEGARALIASWERANAPSPDQSVERRPPSFWMAALVIMIGVGLGWMLKTAAENNLVPIDAEQWRVDQNGDGTDDLTYFVHVGAPYAYKAEYDRNFDGNVDDVWNFDAQGIPTTRRHDDNFDGHMESRSIFRNGNAARIEIDTDRDGAADRTLSYINSILDREEIHPDNPQTIVRVNYFDELWMTRSESDTDGDGFRETVQTYNERGDVTDTQIRQPEAR